MFRQKKINSTIANWLETLLNETSYYIGWPVLCSSRVGGLNEESSLLLVDFLDGGSGPTGALTKLSYELMNRGRANGR